MNRSAVCVRRGRGAPLPPRPPFLPRFFFSVFFFSASSRFPFLIAFPVSFLIFPFSISLLVFPFSAPFTLLCSFSSGPFCVFVSSSKFLVQLRRIARLGRAIERSWLALPGQNNLSRRGALRRCAPRLASGLAPRCAACSSLPLCALGRRLGARRARNQFPDAPPGSSEPGGR